MRLFIFLNFLIGFNVALALGDTLDHALIRQQTIDTFVRQGPIFINDKKSLNIFKQIGRLLYDEVKKVPSSHNPSDIIEFHLLKFDGLEIYGNISPPGIDNFIPIRILVYGSQWPIYKGLRVGSSDLSIEQILGEPTNREKNIIEYCGETDCVRFSIINGKIDRIEFIYYAD